jgi:hypothetical protein
MLKLKVDFKSTPLLTNKHKKMKNERNWKGEQGNWPEEAKPQAHPPD